MTSPDVRVRFRALDAVRERVLRWPGGHLIWRVGIGVTGFLVIAVGIVLLPLPGPGWVIIFLGLGLWATEFTWAARLLDHAKRFVSIWTNWIKARPRWLQALIVLVGLAFTAAVVIGVWYVI